MKTLHRLISALLFLPVSLLFAIATFFEMLWQFTNAFHYKNFYAIELPETLPQVDDYYIDAFIKGVYRLSVIFSACFFGYLGRLKTIFDYEF